MVQAPSLGHAGRRRIGLGPWAELAIRRMFRYGIDRSDFGEMDVFLPARRAKACRCVQNLQKGLYLQEKSLMIGIKIGKRGR